LLNELKRYKDAIEAFDQALEIYPDHEGAINGRQSAIDALNSKNF
jgi:tetratricopeptide (TPR) repeat protein